jgi:hypothetical protein
MSSLPSPYRFGEPPRLLPETHRSSVNWPAIGRSTRVVGACWPRRLALDPRICCALAPRENEAEPFRRRGARHRQHGRDRHDLRFSITRAATGAPRLFFPHSWLSPMPSQREGCWCGPCAALRPAACRGVDLCRDSSWSWRRSGAGTRRLRCWRTVQRGADASLQGLTRLRQRGNFLPPADCVRAAQEFMAQPWNSGMVDFATGPGTSK